MSQARAGNARGFSEGNLSANGGGNRFDGQLGDAVGGFDQEEMIAAGAPDIWIRMAPEHDSF